MKNIHFPSSIMFLVRSSPLSFCHPSLPIPLPFCHTLTPPQSFVNGSSTLPNFSASLRMTKCHRFPCVSKQNVKCHPERLKAIRRKRKIRFLKKKSLNPSHSSIFNATFARWKAVGRSVAGASSRMGERKVRATQGVPLANLQAVRKG